jgi:hypothetical protein
MAECLFENQPNRVCAKLSGQNAVECRRPAASLEMSQDHIADIASHPSLYFLGDEVTESA